MAYSFVTYTGDGATTQFAVPFGYIRKEHLQVEVDGSATTAFTWVNASTIELDEAPGSGIAVKLLRVTPVSASLVDFTDGSTPVARDFDTANTQNLYTNQELRDISEATDVLSSQALTTANTALANSQTAITTADGAVVTANGAVVTANSAVVTADAATAVAAQSAADAAAAVVTADDADSKADQAIAAVANALLFTVVTNVAAIPASPDDQDAVEVTDSTGIESFTPLSGLPSGFVGDAGLSVRLLYSEGSSAWTWLQYFPNDPENRYGEAIADLQSDVLGLDSSKLDVTTAASTYLTQSNAASTYQTQSGMSSYLTTAAAGDTYTPKTRAVAAGTGLTGGGDLNTDRTISADIATQAEAEAGTSSTKLMTPQRTAQALLKLPAYNITTTATSKTLANRERCSVTASSLTITLPASPQAGWEVAITVAGSFTDTVIARNGANIMSLAEDFTIDRAEVTVTLYYVDATRGWRII